MRPLSVNERRLIEAVATRGPIARTELAGILGVTGATVTRVVAELDQLGLFDEAPERTGKDGQPRRLLQLRRGRFFAGGLTFSRFSIEIAVVDLAGPVVGRRSFNLADPSANEIAVAASEALQSMSVEHDIDLNQIIGVGCAMPGNFADDGISLKAHGVFADFDDPVVLGTFRDLMGYPVWLENDGKSAAIGEHLYGRRNGDGPSLFFLHLGHGVGGGAVVDGVPFRGIHGNACLPGFLFPYDSPRPSGLDLILTLQAAGHHVDDFGDLEVLTNCSSTIHDWTDRAGTQLATAALAITALIDPSIIVVGGRLPHAINGKLVERINATATNGPSRGLNVAPVRAATLGPEGGAIGSACLPLFGTFFGARAEALGNNYQDGRRKSRSQLNEPLPPREGSLRHIPRA